MEAQIGLFNLYGVFQPILSTVWGYGIRSLFLVKVCSQILVTTASAVVAVVETATEKKDDNKDNYPRGITASAIIATTHRATSFRAF